MRNDQRLFWKYVAPSVFGALIGGSFAIVDAIFIGLSGGKNALAAATQDELALAVKSKRYTYARINRLLMNIALNNRFTAEKLKECVINFINVLAVKRESRDLLRAPARPPITGLRDKVRLNVPPSLSDEADTLFKCAAYDFEEKMRLV